MQEQSVSGYIAFGTAIRYLQDAKKGWSINKPNTVASNLDWFLRELDELGLLVTRSLAQAEGFFLLKAEFEGADEDATLDSDQASRLTKAVRNVRKTLFAEARQKKMFVTSPKRWDVERLLTSPGELFPEGVFDQLNEHAHHDFSEGAKCLAFERSTAAAFHITRGTEAVLRDFYCSTVKQNRLPKERQMWGPMVEKLRNRSKPPPAALLDNLDAIRKNFRNPTQHPDAIYDIEEAQDLFFLVMPAVNGMVSLMKP